MDLELSEGRIRGAKYYLVRPWPRDSGTTWSTMEAWSIETFGPAINSIWDFPPNNSIWETSPDLIYGRWYMNNSKFWFRNEEDRTWFILRWQ